MAIKVAFTNKIPHLPEAYLPAYMPQEEKCPLSTITRSRDFAVARTEMAVHKSTLYSIVWYSSFFCLLFDQISVVVFLHLLYF